MLKKQPPAETGEEIIDLTEIIQKGKAPLQSRDEVDFDSALSDLMGKVPSVKHQETPELEELLSGIDENAQRRAASDSQADEEEAASTMDLSSMEDVDSLISSLDAAATPEAKASQPIEDVDNLLDSLMDDITPPHSASADSRPQEISEADLDDLLDTIEQESTGKEPAPASTDAGAYSMDDLISGLDKLHKAPARPEPPAAPDSLDDLLAGLNGSAPAKPAPPKAAPAAPDSLDDLLSGLDAPAKFAPPASAKPAPAKPAPAKPAPTKVKPAPAASDDLDDLFAGLDEPAPASGKKPRADSGGPVPAPSSDAVDADAQEAADIFDGSEHSETVSPFGEAAFDTGDMADLDSLFDPGAASKARPAPAPSTTEPPSAQQPSVPVDPLFAQGAKRTASPSAPPLVPPVPASVVKALAERLDALETVPPVPASVVKALTERLDALETSLQNMESRLDALEKAETEEPEEKPQPLESLLESLLDDGSPFREQLMKLMRGVVAEGLRAFKPEPRETANPQMIALESRTAALETMLAQVAAQAINGPEIRNDPALTAVENLSRRMLTMEERQQDLGWERQESVARLDQRLAVLEGRPYVPLETIQGAFDQMGAQLNGPLQQFQDRITGLEHRLGDELPQLAGELSPLLAASIDRAAAESAARALREELAALLGEEDGQEVETEPDTESAEVAEFVEVADAAEFSEVSENILDMPDLAMPDLDLPDLDLPDEVDADTGFDLDDIDANLEADNAAVAAAASAKAALAAPEPVAPPAEKATTPVAEKATTSPAVSKPPRVATAPKPVSKA